MRSGRHRQRPSDGELVFIIEKFGFYAAEHLNPWGQICVQLITLSSVEKGWEELNKEGER